MAAFTGPVVGALRGLGLNAEASGRNDITVDGRKVSGYAKRVYKDRLMIHGTLMYDVDIVRLTEALSVPGSKLDAAGIASVRSRVANLKDFLPQFPDIESFQEALERILSRDYSDGQVLMTAGQEAAIRDICKTKFSTWEWNYGHSPKAQYRQALKLPCGTVEARCSIVRGAISGLAFGGDFIGSLPAEGIAAALEGCRFEHAAVLETLRGIDVGRHFDGTSPEQLAALLTSFDRQ